MNSCNKVAAFILRKGGVLVHHACNGVEVLQALREFDFDIVLMDCQMPELDGYEATRQLRNSSGLYRNPNIPVVALTDNALETERGSCISSLEFGDPNLAVDARSIA